jgi:hypothetical protein
MKATKPIQARNANSGIILSPYPLVLLNNEITTFFKKYLSQNVH